MTVAWPVPGFLVVLGYSAALCCTVFGLWMVWGGRVAPGDARDTTIGGPNAWRDRLTEATRLTLGLCGLFLGYHLASYVSPPHWLGLRVPPERWWLLVGGLALAICGTLGTDWVVDKVQRPDRPGDQP